ncbi:MAG: Holliday junction resolvase RuvX [Clostridiales bacterium]|nr:Holliday junction resolvase RuvX [Clostridiales bacterium]
MGKGRWMGIDFGMKHIGVALSDELWITASGFETVNWNGTDDSWAVNRIAEIVREKNVTGIVLGKPSKTNGEISHTEEAAVVFGRKIEEITGIVPVMKDERYTTVLASQFMREVGKSAKKQRPVIDQVAAEIILSDYLETLRH